MADIQIPKKHKAAVYDKPGSISTKIEELDTPEPGFGEVLINLYVYSRCSVPHFSSQSDGPFFHTRLTSHAGLTLVYVTPT